MLRDGQIKTNFYNYRFIRMNLYLSIPMYTAYRQLAKPTGPPVPNGPIDHFLLGPGAIRARKNMFMYFLSISLPREFI